MAFEPAERIVAGGKPIELGSHATTRCFDWDADGDLDLLVGGGDGRLWMFRNTPAAGTATFGAGQPIRAGERERWGGGYTGVLLADLLGDALPDLVVAHSANQVSIHENQGTPASPSFAEQSVEVTVQDNCQGRIDVADWDGDGLADLVTGAFGGELVWYRNQGPRGRLRFGQGTAFHDVRVAYNSHPRLLDFNQDGKLDLMLGVNWGTVSVYLNEGDPDHPRLASPRPLKWAADGANLSLRTLNGDDTTPELADLDGDGVLDLVSGGKNGRIFRARGVGFPAHLASVRAALEEHGPQLGNRLNDEPLRKQVLGALRSIQADLETGLLPAQTRESLFGQLAELASRYPAAFRRQEFNLETSPFAPVLAAQFWVLVREALPDSAENRRRAAEALKFTGGYRPLLEELGVVFVDNQQATPEQLQAMHRLMTSIPRDVWDVEMITVAGWLGDGFRQQKVEARTAVNIFDLPLGRPENSFPADSPRPGVTDVYMICLAHELAHNMLDTVGRRRRPAMYERKFEILAAAAGPQVVYRTPKSRGIDLDATKARFQEIGAWDGSDATWPAAWAEFFKGKPDFDRAYCRGNVHFFLNAPQEAFATLANQYFADSQLMLEFCAARWKAGYRSNIDQFLLIADYLSDGRDEVPLYVMRPGGSLRVSRASLERDAEGRIITFRTGQTTARFAYQDGSLVTDCQVNE